VAYKLSRVVVPIVMRWQGSFSVDDVMNELASRGYTNWPYRDQVSELIRRHATRGNLESVGDDLYKPTPRSEELAQLWDEIDAEHVERHQQEFSDAILFIKTRIEAFESSVLRRLGVVLECFDEQIAGQLDQNDAREFRRMLRRIVLSPLAPDYDPHEVGAID